VLQAYENILFILFKALHTDRILYDTVWNIFPFVTVNISNHIDKIAAT